MSRISAGLQAVALVLGALATGAQAQGLVTTHKLSAALANQLVASLGLSRKEETTKQIAERMAKNPPTNVPQTQLPNVTYAQGAIAIMAGGTTIGGLGVSGAPGGQFDEECARTALAKIKDRMK